MVFTNLPLSQEFKILGMDNYLWAQALFNPEELERLRGQELNDPHQRFLWRLLRLGVINLKAADKPMDASTRSMRHSSVIGMCKGCEDLFLISSTTHSFYTLFPFISSVPPPPDLNTSLNCSLCNPSLYAYPYHCQGHSTLSSQRV